MSIDAQQIKDSFKGFNVVAITKDDNGFIYLWSTIPSYKDRIIGWNVETGYFHSHCFGKFEITEFQGKDAKDCIVVFKKPVDYSKWIGKLVYAWDEEYNDKVLGTLKSYNKGKSYCFYITRYPLAKSGASYKHCRPVRRDEVQFVEDMDD